MKGSTRIWGTAAILMLAIIGCCAGLVIISNHQAKISVRQNRVMNIDSAVRQLLVTTKQAMNRKPEDSSELDLAQNARTIEVKAVRQLLEKQARLFGFCEEEITALSNQRRQNDAMIMDLMGGVNESTILTVVCVILGFYAVFWLQRYN